MAKTLTKTEVSFWLPIIGLIASVIFSYAATNTKLAVLENKMDNAIALLESYSQRQVQIIANLNELNNRVTICENKVETILYK